MPIAPRLVIDSFHTSRKTILGNAIYYRDYLLGARGPTPNIKLAGMLVADKKIIYSSYTQRLVWVVTCQDIYVWKP